MTTETLDKLIWVLIYGGLLALCLGLFVLRGGSGAPFGWTIVSGGALAVLAGAVLVVVRARLASSSPAAAKH